MSNKKFKNVLDMVRDLTGDAELVDYIYDELNRQDILRKLIIKRLTHNISQGDVSRIMGCSEDHVLNIENSSYEDLKYGDLCCYARAVGCELVFEIKPLMKE